MNLETRVNILEKSLLIEDVLSRILKTLLDINNLDNKTLGHKTSSLSFMTKVDLLYDIEKINSDSYNLLKMFSEIRNQFIHNLDSDSYSIVLDRIEKKKRILKIGEDFSKYFEVATNDEEKERVFHLAFLKLTSDIINCLGEAHTKIIQEKIDKMRNEVKIKENEELEKIYKLFGDSVDEFLDFYIIKMKEKTGADYDFGSTIKYGIRAFFEKKLAEIKSMLP